MSKSKTKVAKAKKPKKVAAVKFNRSTKKVVGKKSAPLAAAAQAADDSSAE